MSFRLLSTDERHNSEDSWESMSLSLSGSLLFSSTSFPTNRKRTGEKDESPLVERRSRRSFSPPDADGAEGRTTIEWCSPRIIRADLLLVRGAIAALTVWPTILRWQCRRSTCLFSLFLSTLRANDRLTQRTTYCLCFAGGRNWQLRSLERKPRVCFSGLSWEGVKSWHISSQRVSSSMVMSCRHRGTIPFQ